MFDRARINDLPVHPGGASPTDSALTGLMVVDFSHFLAGPLATMLLADFGADVIKVEQPGRGEDFRYFPPLDPELPAQGAPFIWANRTKRSVALDIKKPEGLQAARELIARADVLVENFSAEVMERFGLGYEECLKINPRLIYCSVCAFSREGPYAHRLGFDPIAQAEAGLFSMNGFPDRDGVRIGPPVVDVGSAMMACNAILIALHARARTGKGQRVEVALFDTAVMLAGYATMQHLATGYEPRRNGNSSSDTCPTGTFAASDQQFFMIAGNDAMFVRLFDQVLGMPEIAYDPALARVTGRLEHRERIYAVLREAFAKQPWQHWQARLTQAGIPCGEVRTLAQALACDEARTRGLVHRIPHTTAGWVPNTESPLRLDGTPAVTPRPAPAVGQHTQEVLRDVLGYGEARIAELERAGALSQAVARK